MPKSHQYYFLSSHKPFIDQGFVEEEIEQISVSRLGQPAYWDRLYATVLAFDEIHEVGLANKLSRKLSALLLPSLELTKIDYRDEERLNQLIAMLKIIALPTLKPRELEDVCRNSFVLAIQAGLNVVEGIKEAYIFKGEPELAVPLSQTIMRVLGTNTETIGENAVTNVDTGEQFSPTVQNWLRIYNSSFPVTADRGSVERSQFLQHDANVRRLSAGERAVLVHLLEAYDLLRSPHLAPTEENSGSIRENLRGPLVTDRSPLPQPGSVDEKGELVRGAYRGAAAIEQAVARERDNLIKEISGDPRKLRAVFFTAVRARSIPRTVAVLRLLVERDELLSMLSGEEKLKHYLVSVWPEMYGAAAADELARNPNSRQSVQKFLQYLLQERLGLPVGEAARVGAQLSNAFKQRGRSELQNLAYFDIQDQTFKWME